MAHYHRKAAWHLPERRATPEAVFLRRRELLKAMGVAAIGASAGMAGLWPRDARAAMPSSVKDTITGLESLDAKRNPAFKPDRPITDELIPAQYNNFYEFSTEKDDVWRLASRLTVKPWQLEVSGMVNKPRTYDVDELIRRMPLEERVYRFRCVEAWSMVVPWVGFPISALIKEVEPLGSAKYLRMQTFMEPDVAPRQQQGGWFAPSEPWPYTEGLTIEEASNELAMLTVGSYGHVLPKQHGAPIRLIVPWKYGFKNIKSIVKIEFTDKQPDTFWHTLVPHEYGFVSNVNPDVPHPRWSQAHEREIGSGDRVPTLYLNGYAAQVGSLYKRQSA